MSVWDEASLGAAVTAAPQLSDSRGAKKRLVEFLHEAGEDEIIGAASAKEVGQARAPQHVTERLSRDRHGEHLPLFQLSMLNCP